MFRKYMKIKKQYELTKVMLVNDAMRSIASSSAEPVKNVVCLTDTEGEDKEAEESSDAILRSSSWVVSDEVHINIVEQLILMLCVSFYSIDTSRYIYIFGAMQKLSLCVLFLIAETA